ncbi:MAG: Panacea domain-containing protein [Bacilli bacterium]|nr:Panacea domain-containing protein [Bacilli bacterium]
MNKKKMYSDKFKNLVLYILSKDNYRDDGIKKLNKILYFIDFYYYRDHKKFISDVKYAKAGMGPIIDNYKEIFSQMIEDGLLERNENYGQINHEARAAFNISDFTSEEIDHINNVLEKYGKLSSIELESISHEQQPWVLTEKNGEIIDPDLALLIDDGLANTTEIVRKNLKDELIELANKF